MEILENPITIILYNNLAYNLSLFIILHHLCPTMRIKTKLILFTSLTALCLVFSPLSRFFNLAFLLFFSLVIYPFRRCILSSFVIGSSMITYQLACAQFVGCMVTLIKPALLTSLGYSYSMGLWVFLTAIICAAILKTKGMQQTLSAPLNKSLSFSILIPDLLFISFYSFILPMYTGIDMALVSIATLFVLALVVGIVIIVSHSTKISMDNEAKNLRIQYEQEQRRYLVQHIQAITKLKHFYFDLYKGLWQLAVEEKNSRITDYLNRYIRPTHEEALGNGLQTSNIKDDLLRHYIEYLLSHAPPSIDVELTVTGVVQYADALAQPLFVLASSLINNALESLNRQAGGELHLLIQGNPQCITFSITNSVPNDFSKQELQRHQTDYVNTHGLDLVIGAIEEMPNMTFESKIFDRGDKRFFSQRVDISNPHLK